jgi:hypothetical protein
MKSAMRGSELLNRQLAFYSTPNLKHRAGTGLDGSSCNIGAMKDV